MTERLLKISTLCLMLLCTLVGKAADNVTAVWDFKTMAAGVAHIEGKTGTVASNIDGISLYVDATKGKLNNDGAKAQFNANTLIQIPVKKAGDMVTVFGFPNYSFYTLAGVANDGVADLTHKATVAEATAGYVELKSTGSCYLYGIQVAFASDLQEKALYETDFTDWQSIDRTKNNETPSVVNQKTKYTNEKLDFTLCGVGIDPAGTNSKFPDIKGYMISGKYNNEIKTTPAYVQTSVLGNISKIVFTQGATGGKRGWNVAVRKAGTEKWDTIYNKSIETAKGETVTINVNRDNAELRFFNFTDNNNAYMGELHIYGMVDLSNSPQLKAFTANGTEYMAVDVCDQDSKGNNVASIEVSKTAKMVDENSNPVTFVAENGEVGKAVYTVNADKSVTVTVPVTLGEDVANYVLNFVWKPDYTVNYYDVDNKTIIATQTVEKDAQIATLNDGSKATVAQGSKFRGWLLDPFKDEKATAKLVIAKNPTALYALVTDIEGDQDNERHNYDFKNKFFYAEDHEALDLSNAHSYYNGADHGIAAKEGDIKLKVNGNATIIFESCKFNACDIKVTDGNKEIATITKPETDGTKTIVKYVGEPTTLTVSFPSQVYLHNILVMNTGKGDIVKNAEGYYVAEAGNADSFLNILEMIKATENGENRTKIFLPNGTYDLGRLVETEFPVDNISIIGQDMDKTIILTTPSIDIEGLGKADMFYNTKKNIYFQDLTLKNALDYYGSGAAGRAAVIQDRGDKTIYKNVAMLSYQDTYYSQNSAMQSYFENCDVHGTVDFICGGGDVRFQNTTISLEKRNANGTGGRTITAPTTTTNFGYVFDGCKVVDLAEGKGDWNYGRAWQSDPIVVLLNTTLDENAAKTIVESRWTAKGMNNRDPKVYGEYATKDINGKDITPASNKITSYGGTFETILTADQAAAYAYDKMFTSWDPKALAAQKTVEGLKVADSKLSWNATEGATAYAVFKNGEFVAITTATTFDATAADAQTWSVRAANEMGGFGEAATVSATTAIENVANNASQVAKVIYSLNGMRQSKMNKGVNIVKTVYSNGQTSTEKVIVK